MGTRITLNRLNETNAISGVITLSGDINTNVIKDINETLTDNNEGLS